MGSLWRFLTGSLKSKAGLVIGLLTSSALGVAARIAGLSTLGAGALLFVTALAVLFLLHGVVLQRELDCGPVIVFDDPKVQIRLLKAGNPPEWADVAFVDVASDPKRRQPKANATNVYAKLHFFSESGTALFVVRGYWLDLGLEQLSEMPANGARFSLAVAAKLPMDSESYGVGLGEMRDEDEMWYAVKQPARVLVDVAHYCRIDLGGVQIPTVTQWLRVNNGPHGFVPGYAGGRSGLGRSRVVLRTSTFRRSNSRGYRAPTAPDHRYKCSGRPVAP